VQDLEVVHDGAPPRPTGTGGTSPGGEPEQPEQAQEPEEPEEYGLRVAWQSEAVKIEAAEFLIATRIQQDARIRDSHVLARLRSRGRH
jgi:hypothetical protein